MIPAGGADRASKALKRRVGICVVVSNILLCLFWAVVPNAGDAELPSKLAQPRRASHHNGVEEDVRNSTAKANGSAKSGLAIGDRASFNGRLGTICYGPDSDGDYRVQYEDGSKSHYLSRAQMQQATGEQLGTEREQADTAKPTASSENSNAAPIVTQTQQEFSVKELQKASSSDVAPVHMTATPPQQKQPTFANQTLSRPGVEGPPLNCLGKDAKDCRCLSPEKCPSSKCFWNEGVCTKIVSNSVDGSRCSDGFTHVKCFDPSKCSQGVADPKPDARWALVYTHSLQHPFNGIGNDTLVPMMNLARRLGNTDVILLVPKDGVPLETRGRTFKHLLTVGLTYEQKANLLSQGVLVHEADWIFPPNLKFDGRSAPCLGKDIFRIHVLGMDSYAAVAYFDTDTQITGRGDFTRLMRCAASEGYFITTSGPLSPLNLGLMVLRPNKILKEVAVRLSEIADYGKYTGWGDAGFAPSKGEFAGAQCGQGFIWTLLYKTSNRWVMQAVAETGATLPPAVQVDRCIWNHQHSSGCGKALNCKDVVMIHKDLWSNCKKSNQSSARRLAEEFSCFDNLYDTSKALSHLPSTASNRATLHV